MDEGQSEAFLNGWHAHRGDIGVDANPYNEYSQSVSHTKWTSGWCGRFSAVKHDLPLEYDDVR